MLGILILVKRKDLTGFSQNLSGLNKNGETMLRKTLIITLLLVLLAGCAPQATPTTAPAPTEIPATEAPATFAPGEGALTAPPQTFTDGLDRQVTLEGGIATRIVSLAPEIDASDRP